MRLILMLAAAALSASAQTAPEILKQTAETYRALKSYQFEAQVVTEVTIEGRTSRSQVTRRSAISQPNLQRYEQQGGGNGGVRVYDGKTVWEFHPQANEFVRADQTTYELPRMNFIFDPVGHYKEFARDTERSNLLREETIEIGGTPHDCWVVEISYGAPLAGADAVQSPSVFWIEKATHLVWKQTDAQKTSPPSVPPRNRLMTTTFVAARVNAPVPADLFHFEPPAGAFEVSAFTPTGPGGSALRMLNTASPDFTLPDLDGKETAWSSLKGKPVLIDFWGVYCAPCREEMPKIQELQHEFADKGLVILAIDDGETPEIAKKYVDEKGYTFRVLMDQERRVVKKFGLTGIPVVFLIDRDGMIRAQFTGYNPRLDLKEQLKKIGLE
jgi:peroxiredoxin/outer membrane lipoprotein-sorting protein